MISYNFFSLSISLVSSIKGLPSDNNYIKVPEMYPGTVLPTIMVILPNTAINRLPYILYIFDQTGLSKQCRPGSDAAIAASDQGLHRLLLIQKILGILMGSKLEMRKIRTRMVGSNSFRIRRVNTTFLFTDTVFDLITAHTSISVQSSNSIVFRLLPV